MTQIDMFSAVAPSTSVVGLAIIVPRACGNCGAVEVVVGSSAGPHHARLNCRSCGRHSGWMSGTSYSFITKIIEHFGRPTEPITVRHFVTGLSSHWPGSQ
jgi:hypothetical protein